MTVYVTLHRAEEVEVEYRPNNGFGVIEIGSVELFLTGDSQAAIRFVERIRAAILKQSDNEESMRQKTGV
jgi:hypothetical protein